MYEGFSKTEAASAVDSLNMDWNEQAVKVAQSYRSWSSMSDSELKDQLIYEGFTSAQAQYGISH